MLEAKDISEVEDFKVEKGDIDDYNHIPSYIKDSENNFYKLGLLDFHDDDSFVYAKKVTDINEEDIVFVIPPRTTKPKIEV